MIQQNYRIDKQTGAVIFKKSAGRQKAQQREKDIKFLLSKVDSLGKQNKMLLEALYMNGLVTQEFVDDFNNLTK